MKPLTNRLAGVAPSLLFPLYLIWKKSRKITLLLTLITLLSLSACFQHYFRTHTQNVVGPVMLAHLQREQKYFIIHFSNLVRGLSHVTIKGDHLEGDLEVLDDPHDQYLEPRTNKTNRVRKRDKQKVLNEVHLYTSDEATADAVHLSIPVTSFNRMDVYRFDRNATTTNHILSWIGVVWVASAVTVLVAFAVTCNCPQVYTCQGNQCTFRSGVYSGSIYTSLEREDYLPLPGLTRVNDTIAFEVRNVDDEEQFINRMVLMKVNHPAGVEVLADRHGKLFSYRDPVLPVFAVYNDSIDVRSQLSYSDGQYYSFTGSAGEDGLSSVTLSFDRPAHTREGKLLVHAGNSKWSGFIFKQFGALFGSHYQQWRAREEKRPASEAEKWQTEQGIPLKVYMETPSGWQYIDHFALTGNTASRDMVMAIDLSSIKTDRIRIRLESAFQFWDLDKAVMDFSANENLDSEILEPVSVLKNNGDLQLPGLSREDDLYAHLQNQESLRLEFRDSASATASFFLVSSGYYHTQAPGAGKTDMAALLKMKEKGGFDAFSREKFNTLQTAFAHGVVIKKTVKQNR